jgi:trk system potassium uptake protein TrkA
MARQALVIGLGQFGMSLARALASHGVEVIAVDLRDDRVQAASVFVAEAMVLDAKHEPSLARLAPNRRDTCVVAIGDENREGSIMATAMLRQMGAPHVLARATDAMHERILRLVGAHEVVNPERAYGERIAKRLAHAGVLDEIPLGDALAITELRPPPAFVGRNLVDLALTRRFGVTVVAVHRLEEGQARVLLPDPYDPLRADDILVVVSASGAALAMTQRV